MGYKFKEGMRAFSVPEMVACGGSINPRQKIRRIFDMT
jgi:hypothetical protein